MAGPGYGSGLDFHRPVMGVVACCALSSGVVKGISGAGEAIVFTCIWQLAFIAGLPETDDLGILAVCICIQQCMSTAFMYWLARRVWWEYRRPGAVFSVSMVALSPLGNYVREVAPTDMVRTILALVFLGFALSKFIADGIKQARSASTRIARPGEIMKSGSDLVAASEVAVDPASVHIQLAAETEATSPMSPMHPRFSEMFSLQPRIHSTEATPVSEPPVPRWLWYVLPFVGCVGGFLGGLSGMNGPPFILMASFGGLEKRIARALFPMGQLPEVWFFRLPALFLLGRIVIRDAHLYVINALVSQIGIAVGSKLAKMISQKVFEFSILGLILGSSLLILGLLDGSTLALSCLGATILLLGVRYAIPHAASRRKPACGPCDISDTTEIEHAGSVQRQDTPTDCMYGDTEFDREMDRKQSDGTLEPNLPLEESGLSRPPNAIPAHADVKQSNSTVPNVVVASNGVSSSGLVRCMLPLCTACGIFGFRGTHSSNGAV